MVDWIKWEILEGLKWFMCLGLECILVVEVILLIVVVWLEVVIEGWMFDQEYDVVWFKWVFVILCWDCWLWLQFVVLLEVMLWWDQLVLIKQLIFVDLDLFVMKVKFDQIVKFFWFDFKCKQDNGYGYVVMCCDGLKVCCGGFGFCEVCNKEVQVFKIGKVCV